MTPKKIHQPLSEILHQPVSHDDFALLCVPFNRHSAPRHELREQFVQLTAAAAFASDGEALAAEEIFAARWPGDQLSAVDVHLPCQARDHQKITSNLL